VLEAARKYAQKGSQAKALKEFDKVLKLDPRDARLRLEIGDAHRRWGNKEQAIETYVKVAEQYMKEGFDARAVAVYKQIHNLDPGAYATYEPLAELYQRMGLSAEAILALQTAADGYRKQGKKREALELLRKMATIDPTNTTSRIKVADLLRQESLFSEAITEYDAASAELERQGDDDGVASVYTRILEIDPNRIETLNKLAENLIARKLADRAEPLAKRLLEAQPDDVGHYELLASVYRIQKRDEQLADTYRDLAELHSRRGDDSKAREILQRYLPSSDFTNDLGIDANTAFANMGNDLPLGDSGTFSAPLAGAETANLDDLANGDSFDELVLEEQLSGKLDDDLLSDDDPAYLSIDGEAGGEIAVELDSGAREPEVPRDLVLESAPSSDPIEDSEQLLAEASVYLRYGKREQAIANLEAIIAHDSAHRGALEKLGAAYAEGGQGEQAVAAWVRAAEVAFVARDVEGMAVLRDRIAAIDAAAAANLAVPMSAEAANGSAAADGVSAEPPAGQALVWAEGEATVVDLGAIDAGAPGATEVREINLDDIEIDIDESGFVEEIGSGGNAQAGVAGCEPGAGVMEDTLTDQPRVLEFDAAGSDVGESDVTEFDIPASDAGDFDVSGPGASSSAVQQISEDLEEADVYVKQRALDRAEPSPRARAPGRGRRHARRRPERDVARGRRDEARSG
jgi:tetratricopeptide (TPR) repeat protein